MPKKLTKAIQSQGGRTSANALKRKLRSNKRISEHFRQLAAKRKTFSGGRPKKPKTIQ